MKNDFRNDGTQSMAWLADKGASEAELDGQGFLTPKQKQPPESDYERLKRALYNQAFNGHFAAQDMARFFTACNFLDLAHAIREGMRDREKGLGGLKKPVQVCVGMGATDGDMTAYTVIDEYHAVPQESCPVTGEPWSELAGRGWKKTDGCFPSGLQDNDTVQYLLVSGARGHGRAAGVDWAAPDVVRWRLVRKHIGCPTQPDDWIEHDGGGRPGWLESGTEVDVIFKDGRQPERSGRVTAYYWGPAHNGTIAKYRIAEGSIIPDGWRRHDGCEPELATGAMVEYVTRDGFRHEKRGDGVYWSIDGDPGDIMWYRILSDQYEG